MSTRLTYSNKGKLFLLGTEAYAAPEQLEGAKPTCKSDVFNFGVTLYETLTGRGIKKGGFPLPSEVNSSIPKWLDDVVERSLAGDPEERINSEDLYETLEAKYEKSKEEMRNYEENKQKEVIEVASTEMDLEEKVDPQPSGNSRKVLINRIDDYLTIVVAAALVGCMGYVIMAIEINKSVAQKTYIEEKVEKESKPVKESAAYLGVPTIAGSALVK